MDGEKGDPESEDKEYFQVKTDHVGEILAVSIAIRQRHLMAGWFLKHVTLSNLERTRIRQFPCYNTVQNKVTLRPSDGK